MYFIQAEPFERNYSQSQEAGGGGGMQGGDDPTGQISQRQKDIIAATWNELKNSAKSPTAARRCQIPGGTGRKTGGASQIAGRSHESARAGRRQFSIQELHQGHGRSLQGDDRIRAEDSDSEMERLAASRAAGAAARPARRSHLPRHPGCVRKPRRRRRRRQHGSRSRESRRSRTRPRKESVRNRPAVGLR